jgi:acetylxylan esterase
MLTSTLTLCLVALAAAAPLALTPRQSCSSGVYIIAARGSDEDPGYGSTASVVNGVLSAIPGSAAIALDYPASVLDPLYPDSVTDGINAMISLIESYVNSCGGKIVLVGFSQGANVVTDALAGGVDKPAALDPSYAAYSELLDALDPKNEADTFPSLGRRRLWRPVVHRGAILRCGHCNY